MSTDYAAKERAFLDSLKEDTGRDLDEWMRAIAEARLPHRNDTIDWLRQHGFPFSRASWLERIHHNGGRPIYADAGARPAATRRAASAATRAAASHAKPQATIAVPAPAPAAPDAPPVTPRIETAAPAQAETAVAPSAAEPRPIAVPPAAGASLDKTALAAHLAPAKAYRPLAQHLIAAVERAVPSLAVRAADGLLLLCAPAPFAAILPTARDIRLGLDAGEAALGTHMLRTRLPGAPTAFVHTVVLDDARQINSELLAVVAAAQRRATAG